MKTSRYVRASARSLNTLKRVRDLAGLLTLLAGGVGLAITMGSLLSRRTMEIAMLKTMGDRRTDLFLLFGIEVGLLGLVSGVIGAGLAVGGSLLVRNLVQLALQVSIPFLLDPAMLGGGVLMGVAVTVLFGLLPMARAVNVRTVQGLGAHARAGAAEDARIRKE